MKLKKLLPTCLIALSCLAGLVSCGETSDSFNIVCINAGYDSTWIETLVSEFQASHPDTPIKLTAIYESESLITQHLASKNNTDDLYISVGTSWKSNAASGKFADLTDLLDETVDGVKVKDKVADEYAESIYFTRSNGDKKCYRLPFTSGIGGIYYNAKMFKENGWKVPETYDELITLCNTINNANVPVSGDADGTTAVKPFIYSGTNTDYFDYTVFDWWAQLVGKDAIQEFLKYESADNFDVTKNQTYAALKTATQKWNDIFAPEKGFCVPDTNTMTASNAQKQFVNGYAAMMFNGDWLYNESLKYTNTGTFNDTFELSLMKTPVLSEASNENANISYVIGEDQYISVPESSTHKDLAKEFIKYIISDHGCQVFAKNAHSFLAYDANYETFEDNYMNEMVSLRNSYTTKFTNFSSNRKYLCNYLDVWSTAANRPFLGVLNGSSDIDTSFNTIASTVRSQWQYWTDRSK